MAEQNIIAVIWDFDKTLIDGNMQDPIFEECRIDAAAFWAEVNALQGRYARQGCKINPDTIYLNHFITAMRQGLVPPLTKERLRQYGAQIEFRDGVLELMRQMQTAVRDNPDYAKYKISVEHYIVSTGFTQMIRGSQVADLVAENGIWGCEFIERPIPTELPRAITLEDTDDQDNEPVRFEVGYTIDNTTKTRAIFEINKGVHIHDDANVNTYMQDDARYVPFTNMLYIADGPSDVPVFSLLQRSGGATFAVFPKGDKKALDQVDKLLTQGRVNMYGEADYSPDTLTHMWLMDRVDQIAREIFDRKEAEFKAATGAPPSH